MKEVYVTHSYSKSAVLAVTTMILAATLPAHAMTKAELIARMNTSLLTLPQTNEIPPSALAYDPLVTLDPSWIGGMVIFETFATTTPVPLGTESESPNFTYLLHPGESRFLLLVQATGTPLGVTTDLTTHTISTLSTLGITSAEYGAIEELGLYSQSVEELPVDNDVGGVDPPALEAHKRFVDRRIGGITVLESRIVMSYTPLHGFRKMLGKWPGIAAGGHDLNTTLTVDQVKDIVADYLIAIGDDEPMDDILIFAVYDPLPQPGGRIALRLRFEVLMAQPAEPVGDDFVTEEKVRVHLVEPGFTPFGTAAAVPDGSNATDTPLTLAKAPGGGITLDWDASCSTTDTDYAVYSGTIGDFTSHTPVGSPGCTTGGATSATITPETGNRYYLIVPLGDQREGSYGVDGDGTPRPPSSSPCHPQFVRVCE